MAEALILEFEGLGREQYDAVNAILGIDQETGAGTWPDGLLFHAGAGKAGGGWVVFEIWESREAQDRFMNERLGSALQEAMAGQPSRVEWLDLAAYNSPVS